MSALRDLPRLLALVPYLQGRGTVPLRELAEVFEVSTDRLRRDLELVFLCGLPGHGPGDLIDLELEADSVRLLDGQGVDRPLHLTVDEALALVVALRTLAETPGLVEDGAVDRALAKVEAAAGSSAGAATAQAARLEVALEPAELVLATLRDALDRGRALHLDYDVPGRDERTSRDVDPMRLVLEGQGYLEAWCRRAGAVRLFRLDRIAEVTVLDEAAAVPDGIAPRDLSEGLFRPSEDDELVELALRPGAHWVVDYYPCESVDDQVGDEVVVVRLRTPDTRWLRRLALQLGDTAQVLHPSDLAAQVRADAALALRAYEPTGSAQP